MLRTSLVQPNTFGEMNSGPRNTGNAERKRRLISKLIGFKNVYLSFYQTRNKRSTKKKAARICHNRSSKSTEGLSLQNLCMPLQIAGTTGVAGNVSACLVSGTWVKASFDTVTSWSGIETAPFWLSISSRSSWAARRPSSSVISSVLAAWLWARFLAPVFSFVAWNHAISSTESSLWKGGEDTHRNIDCRRHDDDGPDNR